MLDSMNCDVYPRGDDPAGGLPPGDEWQAGLNLLLVCRDPSWSQAVFGATIPGPINACDARGAIAHLASIRPTYSHLLLQPQSDDGLFDTLIQMTSEAAGSDTELVLLGGDATPKPRRTMVRSATSRSVQEALMVGSRPRRKQPPALNPSDLRAALDGGMISARYQPIVSLTDRRPLALEALARLDHPDQGTVLPDRFVPQIEDAGLAARLTELMTERAFADLASPALRGRSLRVTLNFPLDVILQAAAIERLDAQRQAFGIAADQVVIELTESMPVKNIPELRTVLERIRALGYRAAIDDVAPQVPGLDDLLLLPFTSAKLDKDTVSQAGSDPAMLAFLRDVTTRAHANGMLVVAEGVETVATWDLMRSIGVDGGQGFLLARPLPCAAVPVWLDAWQHNAQTF
jgi:EAL domain-containing protein (putative c-di-GMP-specific phosphodiesterase class I)